MKKEAYEENNKHSGACSSPAKAFCRSYGKREKEKKEKKPTPRLWAQSHTTAPSPWHAGQEGQGCGLLPGDQNSTFPEQSLCSYLQIKVHA